MVFCNTKRNTDFVAINLNAQGIHALAIHGGYTQEKRSRTMKEFSSKETSVLICTDVAARGLDIPGITHIYNYDSPKDSKEYIHRVGRTARAGKEGKVINVISSRDYENFENVISHSEMNITREETPEFRIVYVRKTEYKNNRGQSGGRRDNSGRAGGWKSRGEGGRDNGRDSGGQGRSRFGRSESRRQESSNREGGRSRFGNNNRNRDNNSGNNRNRKRRY